jgi:hypothetical protein
MTPMSEKTNTGSDEVGREAVYGEVYNELRRYRDYEFSSSTWYTALLFAVLGFLIATRFGDTAPGFAAYLDSSCWLKLGVVAGSALIATVSTFLVRYSYKRYRELRDYANKYLEPPWKRAEFSPRKYRFVPRYIYYATPWLIVALILVVSFMSIPPKERTVAPSVGGPSAGPGQP